jgi:hypothetical protein
MAATSGKADTVQGKRLPEETRDAIERALRARPDWSPARILHYLEDLKRQGKLKGRLPNRRTVERRWKARQPKTPTAPWSLSDAPGDDARLVLETIGCLIEYTAGTRSGVAVAEAAWIVRLGRAAPELSPMERWHLAQEYLERESEKVPTDDLDALMALAPWRGEDGWERYTRAAAAGWVRWPSYVLINILYVRRGRTEEVTPEEIERIALRGAIERAAIDSAAGRVNPEFKRWPAPEA